LLDAIGRLRDRQDLRFVFAGRGFPELEAMVHAAAQADSRIRFEHGYVSIERKRALYEEADLVALPYTDFNSASGVLADAYAHHVPVVASDLGSIGPSVRSEGSGWVTPPSDAAALASTIDASLSDESRWVAASRASAAVAAARTPAAIGRSL